MTSEEISRGLDLLEKIANKSMAYTITGAVDWPILVAMVSLLGFMIAIVLGMVGFMWRDIRANIRENKQHFEKNIDLVWQGMRDCQKDCCPPRGNRK